MARIRILLLLCFALLASSAAFAANIPESRGATTVSGVYSVIFHLSIASKLPAGTIITCRARIAPDRDGSNLWNPQMAAAGQAAVTGSTSTCAAEIPFSWTVESARGGVVLSYEIDAQSLSGTAPVLLGSARQNIGAAFPAAGGSTSLSVNLVY